MKHNFKVELNPLIQQDLQNQIDYYTKETKSPELGKRFFKAVKKEIKRLEKYALQYEIKYDDIRCSTIPKFPFRTHYRVNMKDKTVFVEAVISTSKNPEEWIK